MSGDTLKYRPYRTSDDVMAEGDIRRCTLGHGELEETFYVVVMSFTPDIAKVKRLHKEDEQGSRYLIKDLAPTGLEYSMFVDSRAVRIPRQAIGNRIGRISKTEIRKIKL